MKTIAIQITFTPPDDAFDDLEVSDLHGALCRAYPLLRMSELDVQQLSETDPRKTFHDALVSLNATYSETYALARAELLIVAAIAVLDAHEETKRGINEVLARGMAPAIAITEERFTGFCGAAFRRMRRLGLPGGTN